MKLLIEPGSKNSIDKLNSDGVILPLEGFAVQSEIYYSLDEIKNVINMGRFDVFVSINKNMMNSDIEPLKNILLELDKLNICGVFFYDISILKLKIDLNLKLNLVWNQTYMVNNYKTCDYYYSKGVKYALLGKEITLDEIVEILNNSKISSMVEVFGYPSVAFSKRKLLTNYYKNLGKNVNNKLDITEKITKEVYEVFEDSNGTNFLLKDLVNGTSIIKNLFDNNCSYIVMRGYGILEEMFMELVNDTMKYIDEGCSDDTYVSKYTRFGNNTNFFFKKTIYQVKKNG